MISEHNERALHRAQNALEVSPETELASRVLQGLCAVYLLIQASRSAPMNEIDAALTRISDWAKELTESVESPQCQSKRQLAPVSTALNRALSELRQVVYPTQFGNAPEHAAAAAQFLKVAETRIQDARGTTDVRHLFASGCCAADITHIAEKRNHS